MWTSEPTFILIQTDNVSDVCCAGKTFKAPCPHIQFILEFVPFMCSVAEIEPLPSVLEAKQLYIPESVFWTEWMQNDPSFWMENRSPSTELILSLSLVLLASGGTLVNLSFLLLWMQ